MSLSDVKNPGYFEIETGKVTLGELIHHENFGGGLREGRTLHHDVDGRFGAGKVVLRSAPPGTGIIAGGPMRAVFETMGVQDVVAKSIGSSNPHNMVKATFDALTRLNSPRAVATRRGKKVADILGNKDETPAAEPADA